MENTIEVSTQARTKRVRTKYPDGKVLRVSSDVWRIVQNKMRAKESVDSFFRRLLNLPNRKGSAPGLFECWVLPSLGLTFPTEAKARGASVLHTAKKGHKGQVEKPIRVREVV